MDVIATKKLSTNLGVELLDVDRDRLLHDPELPDAVLDTLEEHGVVLFREIGVDDEEQVGFGRRLGELVGRPGHPIPEITVITQTPDNHLAEYFRGNLLWHIDGAQDDVPCRAGILSARALESGDAGTEFASTYAAYDDLTTAEQERFAGLRVVHTFAASQRGAYPDPTPEQVEEWAKRPSREHPLVWTHRHGRRSLVLGATADHVVGMSLEEGRALLDQLLERATRPQRALHHDWTVGDVVLWDNRGTLHRACPYEPASPRELHRTTLVGDEPIR